MADIIQYAKFYTNLSSLQKELNDTANLAIHLAGEKNEIELLFGSDITITVDKTPLRFESPVSFLDPVKISNLDKTNSETLDDTVDSEGDDLETIEDDEFEDEE